MADGSTMMGPGVEAPAQSRTRVATWSAILRERITLEHAAVALMVVLAALYVLLDNDSFFNFWTDRDMVRSEMLFKEFQWMGAELSYGSAARTPGGALHYLWVVPTLFSRNPDLAYKYSVLLGMLSLIPFYRALRSGFGPVAAVSGTMVLMASPILFGTLTRLWNPSFQVPFIILAYAFLIRLLAERDTRAFKWMVASLVLGLQMHLSTQLLITCFALALVATWTRIPWREVGLSALIAVALLLPYLIGEVVTGFDNLRQMLGSQGRGAVREFSLTEGVLYNPDNVRDVLRWFPLAFGMNDHLPVVPFQTALSWLLNLSLVVGAAYLLLNVACWLEWGWPIARALGITCGGKHGRVLTASALAVLFAFLYFSYSPQIELVIWGSARYLMFAMPGLAIIAGLGVAALFEMARGNRTAQAVLMVPIVASFAFPAWALTGSLRALDKPWNEPGRDFLGSLEIIGREMNWSLADIISRTTILRNYLAAEDRWKFESVFGIGYELHRLRMPLPSAVRGKCVTWLSNGAKVHGEKGMSLETLARTFEQPQSKLRIVSQKAHSDDLLVVFERNDGNGYCFTAITNRYVFSDEERAMFARYGKIPVGAAEDVPSTSASAQRQVMMNLGSGIYALVKLAAIDGKLAMELHSNQLRGDTYNGGFLDIGMIEHPRLVLRPETGEPTVVTIERGLVGGKGAFTPIRELYSVPPGTYEVSFEAGVFPPVKLGTWPVPFDAAKPVKVKVLSKLKVAN